MKKYLKCCRYFSFLFLFFYSSSLFATELSTKKANVKIVKTPSSKGEVLKTLGKGELLEGVKRKGMYWAVKLPDGTTGFVSILKVTRKVGKSNSLAKAIRKAAQDGRATDAVSSARSRSAVMGVRGLDESSSTAFAGNARPNQALVYSMEDRIIKAKKIRKIEFLIQKELSKLSSRRAAKIAH